MPARKIISKDAILNAAFGLVREEGMNALNMRTLAKRCNCSTQPIYLSFKGAEELKCELAAKITEAFYGFLEKEIASGKYPEYKAVGMGYIMFAAEEPELFKFLFMRKRFNKGDFESDSFDKATFMIMKNYGLYSDDAYKLHTEMWLFVHGIATMVATGYLDWDLEKVSVMVSDVFLGLTKNFEGGNK